MSFKYKYQDVVLSEQYPVVMFVNRNQQVLITNIFYTLRLCQLFLSFEYNRLLIPSFCNAAIFHYVRKRIRCFET